MKNEEFPLPDRMQIPAESVAPAIARLTSLQAVLVARLIAPTNDSCGHNPGSDDSDELLTTADAAKLLNVSEDWVYRRADRFPFARRLSRKALRFSKKGLLKWRDGKST
jgi:hypothetical protein